LNFPSSGYENVDPEDLPPMEFDATHVDMGKVVQGSKVDLSFTFTEYRRERRW
jgi:hypothetical protein